MTYDEIVHALGLRGISKEAIDKKFSEDGNLEMLTAIAAPQKPLSKADREWALNVARKHPTKEIQLQMAAEQLRGALWMANSDLTYVEESIQKLWLALDRFDGAPPTYPTLKDFEDRMMRRGK